MKKNLLLILIVSFVALIGGLILFFNFEKSSSGNRLSSAIPKETLISMKIYPAIQQDLHPWVLELLADSGLQEWNGIFRQFEKQFSEADLGQKKVRVFGNLVRLTNEDLGVLIVIDGAEIADLQNQHDFVFEEQIDELALQSFIWNDQHYYLDVRGDVIVISPDAALIESSANNMDNGYDGLLTKTELNESNHFWINYTALRWLLPAISPELSDDLYALLKGYKGVGAYQYSSEGDDQWQLFGSLTEKSSEKEKETPYQTARQISSWGHIPRSASFCLVKTGYSLASSLDMSMKDSLFREQVLSAEKEQNFSIKTDFIPLLSGDFGSYGWQNLNHKLSDHSVLFFQTKDDDKMAMFLAGLDTSLSSGNDSSEIARLPHVSWFNLILGDGFSDVYQPYFALHHNCLYISDSKSALENSLSFIKKGETLDQKVGKKDWAKAKCHQVLYVQPRLAYSIPKDVLSAPIQRFYTRSKSDFQSVDAFVFQLIKSETGFFNHILVETGGKEEKSTNLLFQHQFSENLKSGPFVLENKTTHSIDILVQDNHDVLYQLDQSNQMKWSYPVDGKIVGDIKSIDAYQNGKSQLIFCTNTKLYMLDRKGNSMGNFPINLPVALAGKMSVFERSAPFESKIFIPCQGNRLYAYSVKANALAAWNPKALSANPIGEVQFFNKSGQSHYFIADKSGEIHIWDERGKRSLDAVKTKTSFKSNFTMKFGSELSNCKLLGLDSTGSLVSATLGGEVKKSPLLNSKVIPSAIWAHFDDNSGKELIVWQGSYLFVYGQNGNRLLLVKADDRIKKAKLIDGKRKLIAIQRYNGAMDLHGIDGVKIPEASFSSEGNFQFVDIDKDGKKELVTRNKNQLNVYKSIE